MYAHQFPSQKLTKSLDTCERSENNNKPLKSILSLDNGKPSTMGTKEAMAGDAAKAVENGRKLAANASGKVATTPSPTALIVSAAAAASSPGDQRKSPKDELTNGSSSSSTSSSSTTTTTTTSGKSSNSSPVGVSDGNDGNGGIGGIAKHRLSMDGVRNINNNRDNGNANEDSGAASAIVNSMDKKSPVSDSKAPPPTSGRNDLIRGGRKATDGDNNVDVENDAGECEAILHILF